jgi:glycerophosphoryl diester phosphodiesterase
MRTQELGLQTPNERTTLRRLARRRAVGSGLRPVGAPTLVIGHMGAPLLATANTAPAFAAAAQLGADGIELDLIPVDDRLVIAHDLGDVERRPDALDAESASVALTAAPCATAGLLLDVKAVGGERELVARFGPEIGRRPILVSSIEPQVLRTIAAIAPSVPRSLTYPRVHLQVERSRTTRILAKLATPGVRLALPFFAARRIRRLGLAAVTVHHTLVGRRLRRMTSKLGAELHVWTVDEARPAHRMLALGVDGIITNDPARLLELRREV